MIDFNGKVHWGFALVIYLFLAISDSRLDHYLNPFLIIIGSLFPDADHRKAPAGRILPLWLFFKHRGFTHTIWGLVLFSASISLYSPLYSANFAFGYLSHLLLDSLTPSGVNWTGFKRKRPLKRGV